MLRRCHAGDRATGGERPRVSQGGKGRGEVSSPPHVVSIARGAAEAVCGPVRGGYVHSGFRRAANLWVSPNILLAITAPTVMRVPNGVVVDLPAGLPDATLLGLRVGMTAWVGDGSIRVPAAGLCIDAANASLWDPRPQYPEGLVAPAILSQHFDRLAMLIRCSARAKRWSFASMLDPLDDRQPEAAALEPREEAHRERLACRARPAASELLEGIAAGETGQVSSAARRLAGLGYGLTPSGDDFLLGVCAALELAAAVLPDGAGSQQARSRQDQIMAIAAAAVGRTTLLSATWLDYAARGEFSAEVCDLLVALADTKGTGLDRATSRLLAVGGLSGLDTAGGVLLGSRAVLSSGCPPIAAVSHTSWPLFLAREAPELQIDSGATRSQFNDIGA